LIRFGDGHAMDNPSRQDHEYEKRSGGQPNLFF
jgi:hypothetical protein